MAVLVAARSTVLVCGSSRPGIVGSNPSKAKTVLLRSTKQKGYLRDSGEQERMTAEPERMTAEDRSIHQFLKSRKRQLARSAATEAVLNKILGLHNKPKATVHKLAGRKKKRKEKKRNKKKKRKKNKNKNKKNKKKYKKNKKNKNKKNKNKNKNKKNKKKKKKNKKYKKKKKMKVKKNKKK